MKWIHGSRGQYLRIESNKYTTLPWNIIHSNHGNGTQLIKDFKKHRHNDHLYTIILFMIIATLCMKIFD